MIEQTKELVALLFLIRDYYTAARLGKHMKDPTEGEVRNYEKLINALITRTEQILGLEPDGEINP